MCIYIYIYIYTKEGGRVLGIRVSGSGVLGLLLTQVWRRGAFAFQI